MLVRAYDDTDPRIQEEVLKKSSSLAKQLDVQVIAICMDLCACMCLCRQYILFMYVNAYFHFHVLVVFILALEAGENLQQCPNIKLTHF